MVGLLLRKIFVWAHVLLLLTTLNRPIGCALSLLNGSWIVHILSTLTAKNSTHDRDNMGALTRTENKRPYENQNARRHEVLALSGASRQDRLQHLTGLLLSPYTHNPLTLCLRPV
jgi:hypothetical protein